MAQPQTFGDFKTGVQRLLKRQTFLAPDGSDVTTYALSLFVNNALIQLQRFLPVPAAIETSWTVSIGPGNHPFQTASLTTSPTPGADRKIARCFCSAFEPCAANCWSAAFAACTRSRAWA